MPTRIRATCWSRPTAGCRVRPGNDRARTAEAARSFAEAAVRGRRRSRRGSGERGHRHRHAAGGLRRGTLHREVGQMVARYAARAGRRSSAKAGWCSTWSGSAPPAACARRPSSACWARPCSTWKACARRSIRTSTSRRSSEDHLEHVMRERLKASRSRRPNSPARSWKCRGWCAKRRARLTEHPVVAAGRRSAAGAHERDRGIPADGKPAEDRQPHQHRVIVAALIMASAMMMRVDTGAATVRLPGAGDGIVPGRHHARAGHRRQRPAQRPPRQAAGGARAALTTRCAHVSITAAGRSSMPSTATTASVSKARNGPALGSAEGVTARSARVIARPSLRQQ